MDYTLPQLPRGSPDTTIVAWLAQPGQALARGMPLLIVVNDRVEVALPAPADGILDQILIQAGATTTTGAALAHYTPNTPHATPPVRATPVAQRLAAHQQIELNSIIGTGPSGRIMKRDILSRITPAPQPPAIQIQTNPSMPFCTTVMEADTSCIAEICAKPPSHYARRRIKLTTSACIAHAVAVALRQYPLISGIWGNDVILLPRSIHLQINEQLISNVQDRNLLGVAHMLTSEQQPFIGQERPITTFFIQEPQSWLYIGTSKAPTLTISTIKHQPCVVAQNGLEAIQIRPVALFALTYDARIVDQHYADAFLYEIVYILKQFDPNL